MFVDEVSLKASHHLSVFLKTSDALMLRCPAGGEAAIHAFLSAYRADCETHGNQTPTMTLSVGRLHMLCGGGWVHV